jgi:hypothetical protein
MSIGNLTLIGKGKSMDKSSTGLPGRLRLGIGYIHQEIPYFAIKVISKRIGESRTVGSGGLTGEGWTGSGLVKLFPIFYFPCM